MLNALFQKIDEHILRRRQKRVAKELQHIYDLRTAIGYRERNLIKVSHQLAADEVRLLLMSRRLAHPQSKATW